MKKDEFLDALKALLPDDARRISIHIEFEAANPVAGCMCAGPQPSGLCLMSLQIGPPTEFGSPMRLIQLEVVG